MLLVFAPMDRVPGAGPASDAGMVTRTPGIPKSRRASVRRQSYDMAVRCGARSG